MKIKYGLYLDKFREVGLIIYRVKEIDVSYSFL